VRWLWHRLDKWEIFYQQAQEIFLLPEASLLALGPTQPPMQWVSRDLFASVKGAGAWNWPPVSVECRGREWMELYLNIPHDCGLRRDGCTLPLCRKHRNILDVKGVCFIFLKAFSFQEHVSPSWIFSAFHARHMYGFCNMVVKWSNLNTNLCGSTIFS
jgi:hypothetical protein